MSVARTSIDHYWRLDGAAGEIPFDYRARATRAVRPGDDTDLQVVLSGYSDPPDGSTEWGGHEERKHTLIGSYSNHAGAFDIHDFGGGVRGYTELHDSTSLLVAVRPPADVGREYGSWGLIKKFQDNSIPGRANLQLSLTYLAPLARSDTDPGYQSRTALAHDLESDPL